MCPVNLISYFLADNAMRRFDLDSYTNYKNRFAHHVVQGQLVRPQQHTVCLLATLHNISHLLHALQSWTIRLTAIMGQEIDAFKES